MAGGLFLSFTLSPFIENDFWKIAFNRKCIDSKLRNCRVHFHSYGYAITYACLFPRMKSLTSLFTISIVRKVCTLIFHFLQFTNNILPHITFDWYCNFGAQYSYEMYAHVSPYWTENNWLKSPFLCTFQEKIIGWNLCFKKRLDWSSLPICQYTFGKLGIKFHVCAEQKLTRNSYYFSLYAMCLPLPSAHLETWSAIHEVGYRVACAEALTKCKSILWNTRLIPWCWKKRPATAYLVNILNMITRQSRNNHQKPKRKVIMTIIKLFENHLKCLTWIFALWHLSPIFVLLKLTYLVTLVDSKLQIDLFCLLST